MPLPLSDLALAAVEHAWDRHQVRLEPGSVKGIDSVLDRERMSGSTQDHEAIVLCYGAWLGEALVSRGGEWIGLHEPVPPRIRIHGMVCSPMDAIRRRLVDSQAATIQVLVERSMAWSQQVVDQTRANQINKVAWSALSQDARFAIQTTEHVNPQFATAAIDPWLMADGTLVGRRVLCLAAGGGTHGPLLALAGADVTIVDFSREQLAIDERIAKERGLMIRTVEASIDDLRSLANHSFDFVVQPVSSCYIRNLQQVYAEVARVLAAGGLYVAQHKQPLSLQASMSWEAAGYVVREPNAEGHTLMPANERLSYREYGTVEFVHTLDELLGGLCRSGFIIEDIQEPPRGDAWAPTNSPEHRATYLPPYIKIKARRRSD